MRFFNFSLLIFLLSVGFADEQKTLTSRDYKKLFSQRFNSINKAIISDDEGKAVLKLIFLNNCHKLTIKLPRFWTIWWRLGGLWGQWWWRRVWILWTRTYCTKSDTWNTKWSKYVTAKEHWNSWWHNGTEINKTHTETYAKTNSETYTETYAETTGGISSGKFCSVSIPIGWYPCNLNSLILIQIVVEAL